MKGLEQIMQGIEMLSLDSFKIGAILLVNIFCFFLFSKLGVHELGRFSLMCDKCSSCTTVLLSSSVHTDTLGL
jgi:hypothetical protein